MRFLYDENLDETAVRAIAVLGEREGEQHEHIVDHAGRGLKDPEIPPLCARLDVRALVTVNHKDFGARKVYFQALISAGVSVVVIRPGKGRFPPEQQTSVITRHLSRIRHELHAARAPCLVKVSQSGVARRSLEDLVAEFDASDRK